MKIRSTDHTGTRQWRHHHPPPRTPWYQYCIREGRNKLYPPGASKRTIAHAFAGERISKLSHTKTKIKCTGISGTLPWRHLPSPHLTITGNNTGIPPTRVKMSSTHQGLSNALSIMCIWALDVHNSTIDHFGDPTTLWIRNFTIVV